jgi:hypothetical protein
MGRIIKAAIVLFLIYWAAACTASKNMGRYYTECTREYNQREDKSRDIATAASAIQLCANSKKTMLEKIMVTKSTVTINQ